MEHNYSVEGDGLKQQVTPPPPRLYKYENFDAQSLRNLKSQVLYFGSPLGFNDPYDCALTPNFAPLSDEEVDAIREYYLQITDTPPAPRKQLETFTRKQMREMLLRAGNAAISASIERFLKTRGVACFSERNDDLLMWSHYGGRYKGFALEFDTSTEPFQKVRQVHYVETPPQLPLKSMLLDQEYDPVADLFCTKSKSWAYEQEWRAIHSAAGTEYTYPAESLTGIYFGPDIPAQALEIVCLILRGQTEHVRLWRGRRSTSEFCVVFEKFTYTTYLEAKAMGLR